MRIRGAAAAKAWCITPRNAKLELKTAIWSVILERVLSVALWFVLLVPAGLITLALPHSVREFGGVMTVLVAVLLVGPLRAAFIKPIFLIMMIVRFHVSIEGQPINPEWDARLSRFPNGFVRWAATPRRLWEGRAGISCSVSARRQHRGQQCLGVGMRGRGQHLRGRADLDQLAVTHHCHAFA